MNDVNRTINYSEICEFELYEKYKELEYFRSECVKLFGYFTGEKLSS